VFLHSFWESSFHSRMLLQATLALSLVISLLKSVCCDFSISFAVMPRSPALCLTWYGILSYTHHLLFCNQGPKVRDKTLTHMLISSLLSSASACFCEEKWGIFLCIYVTVDSSSAIFMTGPNSAQFTLKWETTEFGKLCCGICQDLLQNAMDPSDDVIV